MWQMFDFAGLVSRPPDIHEGTSKWVKAFEEETVALGDIKILRPQQ